MAKNNSGTRDQLIKDLQRVHKLFPNTEPDRDFYRAHGKYTDAAWKKHFSRFKTFVAEAGLLPPFRQVCYLIDRFEEELKQCGELSKEELAIIQEKKDHIQSLLNAKIERHQQIAEILAEMAEDEQEKFRDASLDCSKQSATLRLKTTDVRRNTVAKEKAVKADLSTDVRSFRVKARLLTPMLGTGAYSSASV